MGSLIGLLVARGWSEKAARAISYVGLALALLGALWAGKALYDRSVVQHHQAKIEHRATKANEQAANERVTDTLNNTKHEEELHNAVHSVPDAVPAGPSHALACARLRRAGRTVAACSGPASGH